MVHLEVVGQLQSKDSSHKVAATTDFAFCYGKEMALNSDVCTWGKSIDIVIGYTLPPVCPFPPTPLNYANKLGFGVKKISTSVNVSVFRKVIAYTNYDVFIGIYTAGQTQS